jgi:ribonuclease D
METPAELYTPLANLFFRPNKINGQHTLMNNQNIYIDNDADLKSICAKWQNKSVLAMDTEFIRTNTFYPIPALLQIYDGSDCYLIDPLTISDFEPLKTVLLSGNTLKVLHSCSEDLEVFDRLFKTLPTPLFDTQIAAAFLGYGFSAGYARLIKTFYGIDIPKDETRSDWLQRPLSKNQIEYAALDVIYLYKLYEKLSTELNNSEKSPWVDDCNNDLSRQFFKNQDPAQYASKMKNCWRLNDQQKYIIYHLILWRENKARRKNKPRSHIVSDDALFELALKQPVSVDGLRQMVQLSPQSRKHHGDELLTLLDSLRNKPAETGEIIWQVTDEPLPREAGEILQPLKQMVDDKAERLNVAPEMLARKKDLQLLVSAVMANKPCLPESLTNWRQPIIGNLLLEAAQQWHHKKIA